jgi:uncharacterized protein
MSLIAEEFTAPAATENPLFREVIRGGGMWSGIVRRHRLLRLRDIEGGANVSALFFNKVVPSDRYNMSDTLKAQHIARLAYPYTLHSDMGRVMVSIIGDTLGWHDAIGGVSTASEVERQFGIGLYQELRNEFYRNGYDNFLIELGKWGLGKPDLVPNVNFFSKVVVGDDGTMRFVCGHSKAGAEVLLRAEMDLIVVLNTCHHPMDPAERYAPKPVELALLQATPPAADDPCRLSRPENGRAFTNTENFYL